MMVFLRIKVLAIGHSRGPGRQSGRSSRISKGADNNGTLRLIHGDLRRSVFAGHRPADGHNAGP